MSAGKGIDGNNLIFGGLDWNLGVYLGLVTPK